MNNAEGLTELLHAAEVTVVAVTVDADWDVELDLVIGVVWLGLADIPWYTGTAEHDTGEGEVERIGGGDLSNALGAADPDTVVGEKLLGLVNTVTELGGPLIDVVKETNWDILVDSSRSDVGGVKTSSRDSLVELLELVLAPLPRSHAFSKSSLTISFSRSSKPHKKGVRAPTSIAWDKMDMRWLRIRVISANIVLIHLARSGISMFNSFSTAREKHCSFVIMET